MALRDDLLARKAKLQADIADLRATGTQRMSKIGVKWCVSTKRDSLKRINQLLRELSN